MLDENVSLSNRIAEFLNIYGAADACPAALLCDSKPADQLAYRLLRADGSIQDLNYGELKAESERFAAALSALGVGPGDRVATLMGKSREYLVTLMGIWRLGAVHVPLFTAFAPPAIAYRLSGSKAKAVVCDGAQEMKLFGEDMPSDSAWHIISTAPSGKGVLNFTEIVAAQAPGFPAFCGGGDAPFINIYTSGTTGKPKGVTVPVRALAAFRAYAEFAFDLRPEDVFWCAADPGWAYGLYYGILATFTTGSHSILAEGGFVPERTLQILAEQGVTNFAAAPTIYRSLRNVPGADISCVKLRCASSAGEPLTPDVNDWASVALGVPVHDHYGQTETGMLINNHHHPELKAPIKPGSMGQVMPGWSAVVLLEDTDELAPPGTIGRLAMDLHASPLAFFAGYDNDPTKSAEKFVFGGRWYVTGDTARIDTDGYVHFSARDDDVIIMAGYRIGPFEVETVLAAHPAVAEAAVIATPDAIKGEVMESFIVLRPGFERTDDLGTELKQWVKERYAAHAFPRVIHFADALPKTPSGKVQRFLLKQQRLEEIAGQRDTQA